MRRGLHLAKLAMLDGIDDIMSLTASRWGVQVNLHVDDFTLSAAGHTTAELCEAARAAMSSFRTFVQEEVGGSFSVAKNTVVGSDPRVAREVRRAVGHGAGAALPSAPMLGIEVTGGKPSPWKRGTQAKRFGAVATRIGRYRRLARAAKAGQARKLFTAGLAPAAGWGAEVVGVAPSQLTTLRKWAAATARPTTAGRSLRAIMLTSGDPTARASVAAACRWAKEVWLAARREHRAAALGTLSSWWGAAIGAGGPKTWRSAKGPLGTALMELRRITWSWPSPFKFRNELGQDLVLTQLSWLRSAHYWWRQWPGNSRGSWPPNSGLPLARW